jgi:RimJ/RimL family protein N-acetyltransferase
MAGEPAVPGTWFQYAIEVRETGRMIGDIGLRTDADPRQAEVGFTLSRDGQGRGYATEALRAVLGVAFRQGVHRVIGNCDARNAASARLMERAGMRREAHHVEDWWVSGEWTSSFVYAMLAREFSG